MTTTVQPALIIGLGGSGTDVVRRFKRRFRMMYPTTPYVRFLGIDTAPQTPEREHLPQLSDDEFVRTSDFRMDFYTSPGYIDQHPTIRAWWKGYDGLPSRFINAGAGMKRPIGRLALFVNYPSVVRRINEQLREIFSSDVFFALPEEYRKAVNVYIVSSTCGGTGTGMFLDLAYISRHVVANQFGKEPWVRALLLLPSVFLGTGQVTDQNAQNLRANAFGALTELDYAMSKDASLRPLQYPEGPSVSRAEEPFKSCYFVGNQAAAGAVFNDFEDLQERCAVHIQIELASPLTQQGAASMDNVLQQIAVKPDAQGRPRLYSSFNGDWLELPSARILARWTKRLALRTLDRLRQPARATQGGPAAAAFAELKNAPGYGALRNLFTAHGVNAYLPRVEAFLDAFMDIPASGQSPEQLLQRANTLHAEAIRQINGNGQLPESARSATDDILAEIEQSTRRLIAEHSLADARQLVSQVRDELSGWLAKAQNEIAGASSDTWLIDFARNVQSHRKGILDRQEKFAGEQRQLVIDAAEAARSAWAGAVKARLAESTLSRLPAILVALEGMRDRLQQATIALESAVAIISRRREPELAPGVGVRSVSDSDIDAAFEAAGRPEKLDAAVQARLGSLLEDAEVWPETMAEHVAYVASQAVLQVAPVYLQTLSIPAEEIAKRVDHSSPLAVHTPDWSSQPYARDVERVWLIGLPASMREQTSQVKDRLSPANRQYAQILPHNDEDRVVITIQEHGFPLYSLQEIADCKRGYDAATNDQKQLCFVQPEREVRHWDFMPAAPQEAHQWFALALATGRIRRAGQSYMYNAGKPTSVDVTLGADADPVSARQAARDAFFSSGHASEMKLLINSRLEAEGNSNLYRELESWVREQESFRSNANYPADFVREIEVVRSYMNSIPPY
jgi:tubulin-like protein